MQYQMRQKLFAWGDDFIIKTANDEERYFVDGKVFSIGAKLSFQDMSGNELAFIREKVLSWGPTYQVFRDGKEVALVKKKIFTFFHCEFTVDLPGPDDLKADGDFMDHEYTITRHGQQVATVSKKWFSWTDSYGVDIADGEDDVLILASTVVIDMACHDRHHGSN